ncbi:MAG: hypothetical protein M1812_002460 [Candelaria pacifica]|nr:MAG: hypothetical protein M1812_002460 [Candelaria pacifica]
MPSAIILIADGSEEIEFVTPYDVLVRAGFDVKSAGVDLKNGIQAICSRGVKITPDFSSISEITSTPDILVLPGGAPGAAAFCKSEVTRSLIRRCRQEGKWMGFICAGTTALVEAAGGAEKPWRNRVTSHPSVKGQIIEKGWEYADDEERIVIDGKVITSRGPGTALLFALTIVECLLGKEKREEIAGPMVCAKLL